MRVTPSSYASLTKELASNQAAMAFDSLPDQIIFEIFNYLPFTQKIRIGRVSLRFHEISDLVISETKSLDLNDSDFQRIRPSNLAALLNLCAPSLECIKFPKSFDRSLIAEFAKFSLARLTEIRIDHTRIGNDLLGALLKRNSNLKSFVWNFSSGSPIFPENVVCEHLKILRISCFEDASFRSLIGRCPSLKHFETEIQSTISKEALDEFCAGYSSIETLIFREMNGEFAFGQVPRFWQLSAIRTLIICADPAHGFTDLELAKISVSFPLLEELGLVWLRVTKEGVSSLTSLHNLRKLAFENVYNSGDGDIDEGLARIAECGRLQELQFYYSISKLAFKTLLQFCAELRFLCIWKVREVTTVQAAVEVVQSFGPGVSGTDVKVRICHEVSADVWQSDLVKSTLELPETNIERVITFECGQAIRFWDTMSLRYRGS